MPLVERREVSYNTNNNNRKTNRKTIKMISNEGVIIVEEKTELEKWGMYAKEAAKKVPLTTEEKVAPAAKKAPAKKAPAKKADATDAPKKAPAKKAAPKKKEASAE